MDKTRISVFNNQFVEGYVAQRPEGYEFWLVGIVDGERTVLDHHLTHDDIVGHLEYSKPKDVTWVGAAESEIPEKKHRHTIEMEETIERRVFWDGNNSERDARIAELAKTMGLPVPETRPERAVAHHFKSMDFLKYDRRELTAAGCWLLGQWTDGVIALTLAEDHKLSWSNTSPEHCLKSAIRTVKNPDWWGFAKWGLGIMCTHPQVGTSLGVIRVDEQELHLSSSIPNRIADVLCRVGQVRTFPPAPVAKQTSASNRKTAPKTDGTPASLLSALGVAISRRNEKFAQKLKPGLAESEIRSALSAKQIPGDYGPLMVLYSWRNGTEFDGQSTLDETSFFPEDLYHFMDLPSAIISWENINKAVVTLKEMMVGTGASRMYSNFSTSLFPIFDCNGNSILAVDLRPSSKGRVFIIEFESEKPVQLAYRSFDAFLKDALTANSEDSQLKCFSV